MIWITDSLGPASLGKVPTWWGGSSPPAASRYPRGRGAAGPPGSAHLLPSTKAGEHVNLKRSPEHLSGNTYKKWIYLNKQVGWDRSQIQWITLFIKSPDFKDYGIVAKAKWDTACFAHAKLPVSYSQQNYCNKYHTRAADSYHNLKWILIWTS